MSLRIASLISTISVAIGIIGLSELVAGEPSAADVRSLAKVLDSSKPACQALEVGGWYGLATARENLWLRFHAFYRAPGKFALVLSDSGDGTPYIFCSGKRAFLYAPFDHKIYHSEDAGFKLEIAAREKLSLHIDWQLINGKNDRILVDLPSLLSYSVKSSRGVVAEDDVRSLPGGGYQLTRRFDRVPAITFDVSPKRQFPITRVAFISNGTTIMCLNRLFHNEAVNDDVFVFPTLSQLRSILPVVHLTGNESEADASNIKRIMARSAVVRAAMHRGGALRPEAAPELELAGVDFEALRLNESHYAKAITGLIAAPFRAP
jgi:hypothetical protein